MKIKYLAIIAGVTVSTAIFAAAPAANSDQSAINTLQKQIASVQTQLNHALATQEASTQKAISNMRVDVQNQIAHLQTEMQQMQARLVHDIKTVQSEMTKGAAAVTPVKK